MNQYPESVIREREREPKKKTACHNVQIIKKKRNVKVTSKKNERNTAGLRFQTFHMTELSSLQIGNVPITPAPWNEPANSSAFLHASMPDTTEVEWLTVDIPQDYSAFAPVDHEPVFLLRKSERSAHYLNRDRVAFADVETMSQVNEWLKSTANRGAQLSTILYNFHKRYDRVVVIERGNPRSLANVRNKQHQAALWLSGDIRVVNYWYGLPTLPLTRLGFAIVPVDFNANRRHSIQNASALEVVPVMSHMIPRAVFVKNNTEVYMLPIPFFPIGTCAEKPSSKQAVTTYMRTKSLITDGADAAKYALVTRALSASAADVDKRRRTVFSLGMIRVVQ